MTFDTLILAVAAGLFVVALVALTAWAFNTFFPGRRNGQGFGRREKRLGVVETASVDQKRKLLLVRRDDVEHLIIVGGPSIWWSRPESRSAPISNLRSKTSSSPAATLAPPQISAKNSDDGPDSFRLTVTHLPHAVSLVGAPRLR